MFEEVFEALESSVAFEIDIFGYTLQIGESIVVMWIVMAVLILLAVLVTRKLSVSKPGRVQTIVEMLAEFVRGLCKESIGHHWRSFYAYIGTVVVFLALSNIISVFNFFPFIHLYPPTKDINVAGAMALMSILVVLVSGFRFRGVKGWAKGLLSPMPVMLPINLLEYFTKPLSLCLRLFCNVVAAFVIMELVLISLPLLGAPLSAYFDLFDGILQAYIFVYLTTIYIGEAIEEHED